MMFGAAEAAPLQGLQSLTAEFFRKPLQSRRAGYKALRFFVGSGRSFLEALVSFVV
jgi:hypothetical protein